MVFRGAFSLTLLLALLSQLTLIMFVLPLNRTRRCFNVTVLSVRFRQGRHGPLNQRLANGLFGLFFVRRRLAVTRKVVVGRNTIIVLASVRIRRPWFAIVGLDGTVFGVSTPDSSKFSLDPDRDGPDFVDLWG